MKRVTWFAGGVVVGATTAVYAAGKVKRKAAQLKPVNVAKSAVSSVRGRFEDLADAVREGRAAMREKERELRARRDGAVDTEVVAVEQGRVIVFQQATNRRRS
jgi:hypothetical protein